MEKEKKKKRSTEDVKETSEEIKDIRDLQKEDFVGFHSMIRRSTKDELTEMAKQYPSYTGAWDYDTTLRELLWAYKVFKNINIRLDDLEVQFNELKGMVMENSVPKPAEEEKKSEDNQGLLGGHHLDKGEKKDG